MHDFDSFKRAREEVDSNIKRDEFMQLVARVSYLEKKEAAQDVMLCDGRDNFQRLWKAISNLTNTVNVQGTRLAIIIAIATIFNTIFTGSVVGVIVYYVVHR